MFHFQIEFWQESKNHELSVILSGLSGDRVSGEVLLQQLWVTSSVGAALPSELALWAVSFLSILPPGASRCLPPAQAPAWTHSKVPSLRSRCVPPKITTHLAGVCTSAPRGALSFPEEAANGAKSAYVPLALP